MKMCHYFFDTQYYKQKDFNRVTRAFTCSGPPSLNFIFLVIFVTHNIQNSIQNKQTLISTLPVIALICDNQYIIQLNLFLASCICLLIIHIHWTLILTCQVSLCCDHLVYSTEMPIYPFGVHSIIYYIFFYSSTCLFRFRLRDAKCKKEKWFILDQCCQHNKPDCLSPLDF